MAYLRKFSYAFIGFFLFVCATHGQSIDYSLLFSYQRIFPHVSGPKYLESKIDAFNKAKLCNNGGAFGVGWESQLHSNVFLAYAMNFGIKGIEAGSWNPTNGFYISTPIAARYRWTQKPLQPYLGLGLGGYLVCINIYDFDYGGAGIVRANNIKPLSLSALAQAGIIIKANERWGFTVQTEYEQFITTQLTGSVKLKSRAVGLTAGFTFFVKSNAKNNQAN